MDPSADEKTAVICGNGKSELSVSGTSGSPVNSKIAQVQDDLGKITMLHVLLKGLSSFKFHHGPRMI